MIRQSASSRVRLHSAFLFECVPNQHDSGNYLAYRQTTPEKP